MDRMRLVLACALAISIRACSDADPVAIEGRARLTISTESGPVELAVAVADTDDERATGLMHRAALEPFDGMAFLWPEPVTSTFTMRNTLIPLSIAFWDERGRIVEIFDMTPCASEPCPSYDAGEPHVGAVEVEQGGFEQRGVAVGDRVELGETTT